jgi:hypothetical protein
MIRNWDVFINKDNKSEFEEEFSKLLSDIVSEGSARIDALTDEEIRKVMGND